MPLTIAARTLVDLSGTQTDEVLGRAMDEARRAALVSFADVLRCVEGRTCPQVRRLLDARLHDRSGSEREAHILWVLAHVGLPLPEAQHEVVIEGRVAVLDYAYPAERVAVEFDGFEIHGAMRTAFDRDARRGNRLARSGWLVVRVTSAFTDDDVVREVGDALAARRMAGS